MRQWSGRERKVTAGRKKKENGESDKQERKWVESKTREKCEERE